MTEKQISSRHRSRDVSGMVEDIIKCKWSLTVLRLVREGVCRPGAMQRSVPGLSTKVLNERLRKMLRCGLMTREVFPVVPPRVEYRLTPFGRKFSRLLQQIQKLQEELNLAAPIQAGTHRPRR